MKTTTFLVFYLTFFFLALAGIGLYQNQTLPKSLEILHIAVLVVICGIGVFQAYLLLSGRKKGQPADDELSLGILYRAATGSFLFSLYLWAGIIYLFVKTEINPGILMGAGILGMAALFALNWLFQKVRGRGNA